MTKPTKRPAKRHAVDSHLDAPHPQSCGTCEHAGVRSSQWPCRHCVAQEDGSFRGGWVARKDGGTNK